MGSRAGENQKLKMLYLVKIFEEETDDLHALTMPEIRDRLAEYGVNADRKTLYEDFDVLRGYGVDIIAEKEGRNCLYHLGSRDFELPELKLLVDAVQSSRFITDKKSKELIKKLESLVSSHFLGWIMSLDGDVRIVAPDSVVKLMRETIDHLADQYR